MSYPKMVLVRQRIEGPTVTDIEGAVLAQLDRVQLAAKLKPGMRVAITAGSRGIANIPLILRTIATAVRRAGAHPFLVPAMGSHGGATAEGQVEVLESLGITEAFCGAPILSSMEVVQIGATADGLPVYLDQHAATADGIILAGRVKLHTDFKSSIGIESGLMKMAAIGLGKHKQALVIHSYGVPGIRDQMPRVAEVVLKNANVLCGVAILENAFEQTAKIEAVETSEIPLRERQLLAESAALMPKLPVDEMDLLVVDEIGKNYSGTGMDTNIIGRIRILGVDEPETPRIKYIFARNVSHESHGNALGIGLADLTTRRLLDQIDFQKMNENIITSSFLHRAMIPIVLDTDREAMAAAFRGTWGVEPEAARVVRIANTLHLEYAYVSESILRDLEDRPDIEVLGHLQEMEFDATGNLLPFPAHE